MGSWYNLVRKVVYMMKDYRVVFMGTPVFACGILQTLIDEGYNVVMAVSQPDKKVGRKQELQETPVKQLAKAHGIPVFQPEKIRDDYQPIIDAKPDVIVTCAYGQFVPSAVCDFPKHHAINVHASLLPKYRGGAPIHKAIICGEKETGITIMRMVKKMDAGEMYAKCIVPIGDDETTSTLHDKLVEAGSRLLKETLPDYLAGKIVGEMQNEEEATFAYNITKEEEFVSFQNEEVHECYNHLRGLIDWPVGYGLLEGKRIKFYEVGMVEKDHGQTLGTISYADKAFNIAVKGGYILVKTLQVEGKGRMSAEQFYNGAGKQYVGKVMD